MRFLQTIRDTFARTVSSGWGTADSGEAWTVTGGTASDFSVSPGAAAINLTTVNVGRIAATPVSVTDFEIYVDIRCPAVPTGGYIQASVVGKTIAGGNLVWAQVRFETTGNIAVTLRRGLSGSFVDIVASTTVVTGFSASTFYRMRFRGAEGTFSAKMWAVGTAEPAAWQLNGTDAALTFAGLSRLEAFRQTGNTSTDTRVLFAELTIFSGVRDFPSGPLELKAELNLSGTWTNVTGYTYTRDGITIRRGRADESATLAPGECRLTLNNRDGRFSPRNPSGPYYGQLTRNTPIRVSATLGARRLAEATSTTGALASAPDTAGLSITGDIDIRLDARAPAWANKAVTIVGKFTDPSQRSYAIVLNATGTLTLFWSADGANWLSAASTLPLPQSSGRQAIRATLDVDNGASGRTVTFYTAATNAGTWTQLGAAVVQAGVTSIFDSTASLTVGSASWVGGEIYALEVRQGIGGTARANPDFGVPAEGSMSFADAAGNTFTRSGSSMVTAVRSRFYGEVAAWPQSWDVAGVDVQTLVEAAGVLRRLSQGADPLKSTIQRWALRGTTPTVAYWPMEDASGSTTVASGLASGAAMTFVGTPELASNEEFASSNPLPVLAGAAFSGSVSSTNTGTIFLQMLLSVPAAGEAVDGTLLRLLTTGTAARWDVVYLAATDVFRVDAYDSEGTSVLSSTSAALPNGKPLNLKLQLVQNGADIDWSLFLDGYIAGTTGLGGLSGSLTSRTVGAPSYVQINPGQTLTTSAVGQLLIYNALPNASQALQALRGHVGETAGRRVERLCSEEGITFTAYGNLDDTVAMGPQRPDTLVNMFAAAEAADLGQVFEPRDHLGLAYRTRRSRAMQQALALDYGALSELHPVEDDQGTRNDITVSRIGGSSARATLDKGPLSTQAPPNGVGRYTDSVELNLNSDTQLADHASLRVALGTVDEARYPDIRVRLETSAFSSSPTLTDAALAVEHGNLLTVTGLPAWLPPDQVRQHTIGQTETLSPFEYALTYVCQPASPAANVAWLDSTEYARLDSEDSTLSAAATSTATTLTVAVTAGSPLWMTTASHPSEFPFTARVGGEEVTVTGITGTTSPQTWTVTRSANGVVKAHAVGAQIRLARPIAIAL